MPVKAKSYIKGENITPKIGIIGAGMMASYHVAGFRQAGAKIVGVVDSISEVAKRFAEKNDIHKSCCSLNELLEQYPDLDAVSIATPNYLHMPLTIEALKKNLNVYCEKPPALSAAQMQQMLSASIDSGKMLMFDFNNRARAESITMRRYIDDGVVGSINSAQATWIRRNGIPGFGGWFTNKELSGGGPVVDLLHMIDLSLYFMDYPEPDYVIACTYDDFMGDPAFKGPWGIADTLNGKTDVEAACHGFVTFKTGQCLSIRNSWAEMNEREVVSAVFQGTKAGGKIERLFAIDGLDNTSTDSCCLYTVENGLQVNREVVVPKDDSMGRIGNARNFVEALTGRVAPYNLPEEAIKLMKIIDAIYISAKEHKPTRIK